MVCPLLTVVSPLPLQVRHYRVASLHSHDFRYSRFNCSDGPAPPPPRERAATGAGTGTTTRVGVTSQGEAGVGVVE